MIGRGTKADLDNIDLQYKKCVHHLTRDQREKKVTLHLLKVPV